MERHVVDELFAVIAARKDADPADSYTAKLLAGGPAKVGKKVGEEAVEAAIAAVGGDKSEVVAESADLLYHLLVLWAATGAAPDDVWAELRRRFGLSGLEEKASRSGN